MPLTAWLISLQGFCLSTTLKVNSWCTPSKPSSSSQLFQLSWWEKPFGYVCKIIACCSVLLKPPPHGMCSLLHMWQKTEKTWMEIAVWSFKMPVDVLPPAGVEWQFFSSDRPAGSQHGAKWPEEEQRHQQLQRQPHLESICTVSQMCS